MVSGNWGTRIRGEENWRDTVVELPEAIAEGVSKPPRHEITFVARFFLDIVGLDTSRDASTSLSLRSARAGLLDQRVGL